MCLFRLPMEVNVFLVYSSHFTDEMVQPLTWVLYMNPLSSSMFQFWKGELLQHALLFFLLLYTLREICTVALWTCLLAKARLNAGFTKT